MKLGFDSFKDQFDLTRLAMTGFAGLLVYTLVGAAATVVMQSSHATMVLIITALASGQISYDNALALAIGSNIGTTITAILGAMTATSRASAWRWPILCSMSSLQASRWRSSRRCGWPSTRSAPPSASPQATML
jgi:Na+/phosphate symporter